MKKEKINFIERHSIWFLFAIVILAWLGSYFFIKHYYLKADRGVLGDQFGAINALFSGLAFVGIIYTILLQQKELKDTQESLYQQTFENTFFQMLNFFITSRDRDKTTDNGVLSKTLDGVQFYKHLFLDFEKQFKTSTQDIGTVPDLSQIDFSDVDLIDVTKFYVEFYKNNNQYLSHYFRLLYHLYKFIDQSKIKDKNQYASLVRAQISNYELGLLFYNCLSDYGNEKFKPLAIKYNLFKNIEDNVLINKKFKNEYFSQTSSNNSTT